MNVLIVSPYHGGSHAAWADGLQRHSAHDIELLTLPDRFWKWRMHGGAATLARRFNRSRLDPEVIVATDMLDLSTFLALTRARTAGVPTLLYMHENQLTYPLPADPSTGAMRRQGGERDRHYAFINYASMLAADRIAFNSAYHRDAWFEALPRFLRHFPEYNELDSVDLLRARCTVLPVGIEVAAAAPDDERDHEPASAAGETPLIIWNQRWEYDKAPDALVDALRAVAERDAPFRLALCGQSFSESPPALAEAPRVFGDRLVHFGFADRALYVRLLDDALLTVSTAVHEFFGVAVLEAMAHHTAALLPRRLAYPELLAADVVPDALRERCLYDSSDQLVDRIEAALADPTRTRADGRVLAHNARRFTWPLVSPAYDAMLAELRTI